MIFLFLTSYIYQPPTPLQPLLLHDPYYDPDHDYNYLCHRTATLYLEFPIITWIPNDLKNLVNLPQLVNGVQLGSLNNGV